MDEKDYIEAEIKEESFYNYLTKFITLPFNKNKYSDKVAIDVEPKLENTVSNLPEQSFFPISGLSPKRITRTSPLVENFHNNMSFEEMIEHDIIVRMPPKKRHTLKLQVVSIKRAQPKIVEPEGI